MILTAISHPLRVWEENDLILIVRDSVRTRFAF